MKRLFFTPRGHNPVEKFIRALLLVGVFAIVVVAYQKHFDKVIEQAEAKGTVADTGHLLTDDDRRWLLAAAQNLRQRFGLELKVRVGGTPEPPGPDDPKMVWVYLDPTCQASRVVAPALVASALPEGLLDDLGRAHLDAACRDGRPREGVLACVGLFMDSLAHAADRGKGAEHD